MTDRKQESPAPERPTMTDEPHAHMHVMLGGPALVACSCGWSSGWHPTEDEANAAHEAHVVAAHPEAIR